MTPNQFINFVKKECKKNKVFFYRSHKRGIPVNEGSAFCNGYFSDGSAPELAIATGKALSSWFPILVHEYCHMLQWKENSPLWNNTLINGIDSGSLIELWLSKKIELTKKQRENVFKSVIKVEADCEKRAVALIEELKLPLSREEYAQRANAYILFYFAMKQTRRWYILGNEPYNDPRIYSKMPTKIIKNINKVDRSLLKLFFKKG